MRGPHSPDESRAALRRPRRRHGRAEPQPDSAPACTRLRGSTESRCADSLTGECASRRSGNGRACERKAVSGGVLDTFWIHFLQNFACIKANLGLPCLRLQQSATLRKHWLKPRFRLFYWDFSDRGAKSPALPTSPRSMCGPPAGRAPAIRTPSEIETTSRWQGPSAFLHPLAVGRAAILSAQRYKIS